MNVQERTVVDEAEEEAKRNHKKVLGIFPVKKNRSSGSGHNTPTTEKHSGASTPNPSVSQAAAGEYELEDDDLPPREEVDIGQLHSEKDTWSPVEEEKELEIKAVKQREEEEQKEREAIQAIPKTAGFDFQAISRELGKNIDVDKLKEPEPRYFPPALMELHAPLERSGSAPPPTSFVPPPAEKNVWV